MRHPHQLDWFRAFWQSALPPDHHVGDLAMKPGAASSTRVIHPHADQIPTREGIVRVEYFRHPRAKKYRLLFRRDGTARCTIPRGGNLNNARRFVAQNESWLVQRWHAFVVRQTEASKSGESDTVLVRGDVVHLPLVSPSGSNQTLQIGDLFLKPESLPIVQKSQLEEALQNAARTELPRRLAELAAQSGLTDQLRRITVRSQRTRWGSCSRKGAISLNWRLIQLPAAVSDYVMLHELAHLRHLNHSREFWKEVERLCPNYREAEQWLSKQGRRVI